ncbi:Beta-lactamase [Novymonas esmeraldas]|uniref:Beta-lactamase n=1 Tax=Novymonas esmeraldas TaxID=1808958 RepID=A0AAW0EPC3_9TRYP
MPSAVAEASASRTPPSGSAGDAATAAAAPPTPPRLRINFPPVKDKTQLATEQRAAVGQAEIRGDMERDIPPVIRSVLELAHLTMSGHSQWLRAAPGYQGGLFHKGEPFCFASGYRDTSRPLDAEDKGNHMKLKDPLIYGTLSLPITAAYLCELHGRDVFNLERPLVDYLPELHGKLADDVTGRRLLAFTHGIDDAHLLADAGARWWRPCLSPAMCAETRTHVYDAVDRFLAGGTTTTTAQLTGQQQRSNLVQYIRSAPRITRSFARPPRRCSISHTSVALLLAAVETRLAGRSFEEDIRKVVFEPAQSHGSGYGAPSLWKDPNELFYQPTGQAHQHTSFKRPLPIGDRRNCGPALWNGSMNLYAPAEDYGKLLMLSLDTIADARELLGKPTNVGRHAHYDFGVEYLPSKDQLQLTKAVLHGIDALPAVASFRYNCAHDLGCFGIASCGTRGARLFVNNLSGIIQHLFVKHVLAKGIDPAAPANLDDPAKAEAEAETIERVVKKQKFTSYFTKYEAHRRY